MGFLGCPLLGCGCPDCKYAEVKERTEACDQPYCDIVPQKYGGTTVSRNYNSGSSLVETVNRLQVQKYLAEQRKL